MKILCVIDSLGSGGAQRQLVNLAIGFKEKGHNLSFLVYHSNNFFKEILNENDIEVCEILEQSYLKRLLRMRKFIRIGGFDSVLSFLEAPSFICEIAGLPWRKWKLVVGERSADPAINKSFKLKVYRWFHIVADHVVANSKENIKLVQKINPIISTKRLHVIYNMINFSVWKPTTKEDCKEKGTLNLIVLASHQYLKNLNGLVEAVNLLSTEDKSRLKIDWYGNQGNNDSYHSSFTKGKEKITEYKLNTIFTFYKPTNQIHEILPKYDAVGLFSIYEGFPNVICEGMACAKPIISSSISDIPFFVTEKRFLFNPNDAAAISKSISALINLDDNELNRIGYQNYKLATNYFDKDAIIKQYLKLLS